MLLPSSSAALLSWALVMLLFIEVTATLMPAPMPPTATPVTLLLMSRVSSAATPALFAALMAPPVTRALTLLLTLFRATDTPTPASPAAPTPPVESAVSVSAAFTVMSLASRLLFVTRIAVSPVVLLTPTLAASPAPMPTAALAVTRVFFQWFSFSASTEIFFPSPLSFAFRSLFFTSAFTVEASSMTDTPAPAAAVP